MSWRRVKVCDSCDEPIAINELQVAYIISMNVSIDLHKRCADKEPDGGMTVELARKARAHS